MQTLKDAKHTLVKRNHLAKPEFVQVGEEAQIVYNGVLFVIQHVPLLEIVPGVFPEWYFTGELDPEDENYEECCEKFYREVEEEYIIPAMSLNKGELRKCSYLRVIGDWIDAKLDNGWRHIRIPRDSVVVLSPAQNVFHAPILIQKYENDIIHATN